MNQNNDSDSTRRRFLQGAAAVTAGTAIASSSTLLSSIAFAQDPPTCPTAPVGGVPFTPGSDKRPIVLRNSISALSGSQLAQLKLAFVRLRALGSSDKRTWLLQADIHSLFCNQCNGVSMQIHDSWGFFPWHRAYLYYYERILGSLVGDIDQFRLPYWDWENSRSMPAAYLSPSNSGNSLWDGRRDSGIAGGGSLPASDGTTARINTLLGITDFATFGGTAGIGGACENDPHNIIHGDVGPHAPPFEDMGNLGYAARDPIFFSHHCNIDKLWSAWNAQAGGGTAYHNPTDPGFLNARWSFYDENQQVVSISAGDVLSHEDNLRYTYQGRKINIPIFYAIYKCEFLCCTPGPDPGPFLKVSQEVRESVLTQVGAGNPAVLVLSGVEIPQSVSGAFDIAAIRGDRRSPMGALTILGDTKRDKTHKPVTLFLDISKAASDLLAPENPASIHLFNRHPEQNRTKPFILRAQGAQIRTGSMKQEPRS